MQCRCSELVPATLLFITYCVVRQHDGGCLHAPCVHYMRYRQHRTIATYQAQCRLVAVIRFGVRHCMPYVIRLRRSRRSSALQSAQLKWYAIEQPYHRYQVSYHRR